MKIHSSVRAWTTFAILGAVVAVGVACVGNVNGLFASSGPAAGDDPLTNRLALVDPPSLTVTNAALRDAAGDTTVTTLDNWSYTDDAPPTRFH